MNNEQLLLLFGVVECDLWLAWELILFPFQTKIYS